MRGSHYRVDFKECIGWYVREGLRTGIMYWRIWALARVAYAHEEAFSINLAEISLLREITLRR